MPAWWGSILSREESLHIAMLDAYEIWRRHAPQMPQGYGIRQLLLAGHMPLQRAFKGEPHFSFLCRRHRYLILADDDWYHFCISRDADFDERKLDIEHHIARIYVFKSRHASISPTFLLGWGCFSRDDALFSSLLMPAWRSYDIYGDYAGALVSRRPRTTCQSLLLSRRAISRVTTAYSNTFDDDIHFDDMRRCRAFCIGYCFLTMI